MLKRLFESYIFSIRWLLLPFIFMLSIGLVGIMLKAARKTLQFIQVIYSAKDGYIKVELLELIDLTLVAALVIIVTISVYGNFISTISRENLEGKPAWMATVDFTHLKLKLLTTMVVISAVRLLELFMEVPQIESRDIIFYIALHLTLVVSRLALGYSPYASEKE
jgi:uncharacterized protein (TIGR00645 family)